MTIPKSATAETTRGELAHEAIELVQRWLSESVTTHAEPDPAAERLAGVLRDPKGLDFAVGFVDGVARPQDIAVAGRNLRAIAAEVPGFLPWYMRAALRLGGVFGPIVPWAVIPIARGVLRRMVGHLLVDATPAKLGPALAHLRAAAGVSASEPRLNINLLGEAVLGEREAARRLQGTRALLERDDVDYVSIKVSSIMSHLSLWAFDEAVATVAERLTPLYELAARRSSTGRAKFINLDMEEYHDLDLTIAVFTRVLDQPQLRDLEVGIVLQAYLPDALAALQRLTRWAARRRADGGAPIKVRVVKGANLMMERVDAAVHGWPQAPYETKQSTDANYKRVLEWAFTPEHIDAVRIGVAGHNLFDVAYAWLLAEQRGVTGGIDFEMLLGMATAQAAAVTRTVGDLVLYTPVVHPQEFDVAISYLIRRLEENASDENFMSAVFELTSEPRLFEREKRRFLTSVAQLEAEEEAADVPVPNRRQNRATERPASDAALAAAESVDAAASGPGEPSAPTAFRNEPDTDPALPANRDWGRSILERLETSTLGAETVRTGRVDDAGALDAVVARVRAAGIRWGEQSGAERAAVLDRAAEALAAARADLIEVMGSETGKTIDQADPEVSEATDFARFYATLARDLDAVDGARFVPSALTVVTPPWNFPVAIPAGSMLSALAAGSGVIVKPAPQARRCAAVVVEALWRAGVPRDVLAYVDVQEGELGQALIADPRIDRVILTGAYDTATLFRSWRSDLPLLAETSGKNAIIVTPSADYDLAVADIVASAFGHAGQKCSAASLVILVGSVATSERFRRQLVDATQSLRVGSPSDPMTQVGPLVEPASGKLLGALTGLDDGESWLVEPRALDESGALWSPGIRAGVRPGSHFHLTEFFGPVLGVMRARTLAEAIGYQNAVDYGLTAGLHSLDPAEVAQWIDAVEAGNLYVNRGITGAVVRRQPFGGWKRSSVGAGTKAGGENYLVGLGNWVTQPATAADDGVSGPRDLGRRAAAMLQAAGEVLDAGAFESVRRAVHSDARAVAERFGVTRDVSALGVERNVFRYRAVPVSVRLAEGAPLAHLVRVLAASAAASAATSAVASADSAAHASAATPPVAIDVSVPHPLPPQVAAVLGTWSVPVTVEPDAQWLTRLTRLTRMRGRAGRAGAAGAGAGSQPSRVRLIGGDAKVLCDAVEGTPDVAVYAGEVTESGRVELLPFLHEQALSITNHRFGDPTHLTDALF